MTTGALNSQGFSSDRFGSERFGSELGLMRGGGALACHRLDGGLCGSTLCRRRIPSARRRRHIDSVVGLGFGGEGLDRELCCGERLRIEPLGNVVALATGIGVALGRG